MLFKRKKSQPLGEKISNYLWPSMGWRRFFNYIKHRVIRLADSSHKITLGLAFGVFASFNPFVGTHVIQACTLSFLFRGNVLAGAIGTVVGNPTTFPFFWLAAIKTGNVILGALGMDIPDSMQGSLDFSVLFEKAKSDPLHILLPWTLGGYIVGTVAGIGSYLLLLPLIKTAKRARAKLIALKQKKLQEKREADLS